MGTRLVGLVLVPCVGLGLIAGGEVDEHRRLADEAQTLVSAVDRATLALDAHVAASQENRLVSLGRQAGIFGLSLTEAGDLLGIDLAAELAAVRERLSGNALADELVDRVGGAERLDRARRSVDAGVFEAEVGDQAIFPDLSVVAADVWVREVDALTEQDVNGTLEGDLRRALHSVRTAAALFRASYEQLLVVAGLAVPGSAVREVTPSDLAVMAARFEVALEQVVASADVHLRFQVRPIAANRSLEQAIAETGLSEGRPIEVPALAALFRTALARDRSVEQLTTLASADARAHAVEVGATADDRYRRTLLVTIGLLAGTFGMTFIAARSISMPLRRLARRAAEVSDGELDGEPLPQEGPRETAVLAATLNDAVSNLRAVEEQMAALATANVAAAAQATAPGKLGALVGRSVDELARSISERDRLHERLAHDAAHDALTGLANRRTAIARLNHMLGSDAPVGLLFLDLDGFKLVNDEWGHAVGDAVLQRVAMVLRESSPTDALLARLGGDEFVLALPSTTEEAAARVADDLVARFGHDLAVEGVAHSACLSIGLAVSQPGDDASRLLSSADSALHEAKRGERGSVVLLDDALRRHMASDHELATDLRRALLAGDLEVHYQPIFAVDGPLDGVEALVRWRRVSGTLVPPDRFIPVAEQSGLILDIDAWVLDQAIAQAARWRDGPFPLLRLSVNMSAKTLLSSRLVDHVGAALRAVGLDAAGLTLEVTETALLHDLERAATQIGALRDLGVRTSVDDYGTGYTSVAHLRMLPVSEIKIDASFIQAMGEDVRDHALADLIARIGNALALDVVAEGIETETQLDGVRALGCAYAQGYLLGRPLPAAELEAALAPTVRPTVV